MGDSEILVRGRLLISEHSRICLSDDTGKMFFYWDTYLPENIKVGDILELCIYPNRNGRYDIKSHSILVSSRRSYNSGDWTKFHEDGNSFELVKHRSHILENIRTFFKLLGSYQKGDIYND